ncbi:MAG: adenylate/guanylate cyclase domain-containing protein [Candidatus Eremiobacteraeota bacterium]|nr:adenylate/guanylate cyclase domain-containing protein [Candidatus Eremiobacteraeota bacterium]
MKMRLSGKSLLLPIYAAIFLFILCTHNHPYFHFIEFRSLGTRMRARDLLIPPVKSKDIVVVNINGETIEKFKDEWPWPLDIRRERFTRLIETLNNEEGGRPKAITFDFIFGATSQKCDEDLRKAIERSKNIIFSVGYDPEKSRDGSVVFSPLSHILRKADPPLGSIIMPSIPDERIVTLPVFVKGRHAHNPTDTDMVYLLEVIAAKIFMGTEDLSISKDTLWIGSLKIPVFVAGQSNDWFAHKKHYEFVVSYRGVFDEIFPVYSLYDVLSENVPRGAFKDKAVLIINSVDTNDQYKNTMGTYIPGGFIHAYVLKTLIEQDVIYPYLDFYHTIYFILSLLTALILYKLKNRTKAYWCVALLAAAYGVFTFAALIWLSWWLPLVFPLTGLFLLIIGYAAIENYLTKRTLSALLPSSFMDRLDPLHTDFEAGGKPIWATVMFADIRGYTNLSESLSSEEVFSMLVEYHTLVKKPLYENGGEIFDFQGDAYMVVFGADGKEKHHARKAVLASLGICEAIESLKRKFMEEKQKSFDVGIGLCTGEVTLGYIGHKDGHDRKLQPAAIGDTTNVAARMQGKSSELGSPILMTETTMKELEGDPPTKHLAAVEVKGKSLKLNVYTVDWEKLEKKQPS